MPYFTIMCELRGCYADNDSAFTIKADTRRDLKAAIVSEARDLRDAGAIGLAQRNLDGFVALAWRARKSTSVYPLVQPYGFSRDNAESHGIMVYNATRADYLDAQAEA